MVSVNSTAVSSGRTDWAAVLTEDGTLYFRDRSNGPCNSESSHTSGLTSLPSSWTSGPQSSSCPPSAYVTGDLTTTAAPVNTAWPTISGATTRGQTLTSANGSRANSPSSYSYAWQDCDTPGAKCTNISGATASSYTLQAGDVGAPIRSVVTASNSGGSASASSATAVVNSPFALSASFAFSPVSPVTGQTVHFAGTASACAATPCSYTWADDPPGRGTWPLGTGRTIKFTFTDVGTKYVTLTVTDALNRSARVEHNVVVTSPSTSAPTNTARPTIRGQGVKGRTLTTTNGSWANSPTSYSYQWQDCASTCANISGATRFHYTLQASDVGDAIDVVVTATNSAGSGSAISTHTATVTAASHNTDCAGTPGSRTSSTASLDACGYPSPDNTGVPAGTSLTRQSGDITITTPGTTIDAIALTEGTIHVNANNVTIENSSFTLATTSGQAIFVNAGVTGTVVKNCTFHGTNNQSGSLFVGVFNESGDQLTMDHDQAYWTDDILHGSGRITNSYSLDDANIPNDHYEPIYYGGGGGSLIINHDTLLNPHSWTAAVFTKTDFGDIDTVQIENSVLAGGGYTLYGGLGGNNGNVNGPETVENNRFSRLYYPKGGYWGTDAYFPSKTTWTRNIWDDTLAPVPKSS